METSNTFGLNEEEQLMINRLVPLINYYVESQIDSLIARIVGRYMNLPLTVEMVASLLGENPKTIYKWSDRGRLRFNKNNGKMTITIQELNEQLSSKEALNTLLSQFGYSNNSLNINCNGKEIITSRNQR